MNEIKFYNLEGIVPNDHWGDGSKTNFSAAKEYDFMHFKGKGHIILSNELSKIISNKNALLIPSHSSHFYQFLLLSFGY